MQEVIDAQCSEVDYKALLTMLQLQHISNTMHFSDVFIIGLDGIGQSSKWAAAVKIPQFSLIKSQKRGSAQNKSYYVHAYMYTDLLFCMTLHWKIGASGKGYQRCTKSTLFWFKWSSKDKQA